VEDQDSEHLYHAESWLLTKKMARCVGWMGGWMDGWMGGWVGGWLHVVTPLDLNPHPFTPKPKPNSPNPLHPQPPPSNNRREGPQKLAFTIPIHEPLPPQYYVRVVSDSWLGVSGVGGLGSGGVGAMGLTLVLGKG